MFNAKTLSALVLAVGAIPSALGHGLLYQIDIAGKTYDGWVEPGAFGGKPTVDRRNRVVQAPIKLDHVRISSIQATTMSLLIRTTNP